MLSCKMGVGGIRCFCQFLLPDFYKLCKLSAIDAIAVCPLLTRESDLTNINMPSGTKTIN